MIHSLLSSGNDSQSILHCYLSVMFTIEFISYFLHFITNIFRYIFSIFLFNDLSFQLIINLILSIYLYYIITVYDNIELLTKSIIRKD